MLVIVSKLYISARDLIIVRAYLCLFGLGRTISPMTAHTFIRCMDSTRQYALDTRHTLAPHTQQTTMGHPYTYEVISKLSAQCKPDGTKITLLCRPMAPTSNVCLYRLVPT